MSRWSTSTFAGLVVACAAALSSCTEYADPATLKPSYVAMETNSGRILFASNSDMRRPVGMLANVATAMVILDWIDAQAVPMDQILTVPQSATQWQRTNLLKLMPGDRITLRDALHSTIMWDDSACAATLAHACGLQLSKADPDGAFIAQMNKLALTLRMSATRFKGTNGSVISQSTAKDMALLSMYAIQRPLFQAIAGKRNYVATVENALGGARQEHIINSNQMLSAMAGVDGVRAARSASAGSCLAVSVKRPSVKLINPRTGKPATYAQRLLVVILGAHNSRDRYIMAGNLLRDSWGAWEDWQKTDDYKDHTKFINLPQ